MANGYHGTVGILKELTTDAGQPCNPVGASGDCELQEIDVITNHGYMRMFRVE